MKKSQYLFVFTVILLMVFCSSCASARGSNSNAALSTLAGAWEMVSSNHVTDRPVMIRKYFSDAHFVVVEYTNDGRIRWAHAGTYTFRNGQYVEDVLFSTLPLYFESRAVFTVDYHNGLKTNTGTTADGLFTVTEVWRRTSSSTNALSGIWRGTGGFANWKIISNTEFVTFTANEQGRISLLTGGIYVWNAEVITEHIDFSTWAGAPFTVSQFRYNIENNRKTLSGTWMNGQRELNERWVRMVE